MLHLKCPHVDGVLLLIFPGAGSAVPIEPASRIRIGGVGGAIGTLQLLERLGIEVLTAHNFRDIPAAQFLLA